MPMNRRTKKRVLALTGIVLFLAIVAGGGLYLREWQRDRRMERSREEGMAAYAAGDLPGAVSRMSFFVARTMGARPEERDGEALLAWADARWRSPLPNGQHIPRAITAARAAVEAMPDDRRPRALLLKIYADAGFWQERLDTANAMLRADPASRDALVAKIETAWLLDQREVADEAARALVENHPDDPIGAEAAIEIMRRDQKPDAEIRGYAADLARRHPDNIEFAMIEARSYALTGDMAAATEAGRRLAQLDTEDGDVARRAVILLDALGQNEEAARFLARLEQQGKVKGIAAIAVERSWKAGDFAAAHHASHQAIDDPGQAQDDLLGWAVFLHQGAPDADAAKPADAELRRRSNPVTAAWIGVIEARGLMEQGDWARARDRLLTLIDRERSMPLAEALLAECQANLGETNEAITRWRAIASREPRWLTVRLSLISALMRENRLEEADQEARALRVGWPTSLAGILVHARVGAAMADAGRARPEGLRDMVRVLEEIQKSGQAPGEINALLVRLRLGAGDREGAQAALDALLAEGAPPAPAADVLTAAKAAHDAGLSRYDELVAVAQRAGGDNPDVVFATAMEALRAGRADEGAAMLREKVASSQGALQREYQRRLAQYLDQRRDPAGHAMLRENAEKNPTDAAAQIDLLTSETSWNDESVVQPAIERLKAVSGESSARWRIFEARRLLTFTPSQARAAQVVQLLTPVLQEDGSNISALLLNADALKALGDRARAVEYLSRAVDANRDQPALALHLIELLQDTGQTGSAQQRLASLLGQADLNDDLRRQRARLLFRQGMLAESAADLEVLAAAGDLRDLLQLGVVRARLGEPEKAAPLFERILAAPAPDPAAVTTIAAFYAGRGEVDRAMGVLDRLPEGAREKARASVLERAGRVSEAERMLRGIAESSDTPADWADLAALYVRDGRAKDAAAAIERGKAKDPENANLRRLTAAVAMLEGRDVPRDMMQAILGGADGDPALAAVYEAAQEFERSKDAAAYLNALRRIRDERPTSLAARRQLVAALLNAGDLAQAATESRATASAMPASPEAARMAAEGLSAAGRLDEAIAMGEEWRRRSMQDTFPADGALAQLFVRANRPADALRLLDPWKQRIAATSRDDVDLAVLYGTLLAAAGRDEEAHALLWPVAQADPRAAAAYPAVARSMLASPDRARAWLARAEPLLEAFPVARVSAAQVHFDLAGVSGAKESFAKVIEVLRPLPESDETRGAAALLRAGAYEQMGDLENAEVNYRACVDAQPQNAVALNNLAYLLIKRGKPPEESLAFAVRANDAAKAMGLTPLQRANFLDTLGVAQLRAGRVDDADASFREGLSLDDDNVHLMLGMAEVHARKGRTQEAADLVRRLKASPNLPTYAEFTARLQALQP